MASGRATDFCGLRAEAAPPRAGLPFRLRLLLSRAPPLSSTAAVLLTLPATCHHGSRQRQCPTGGPGQAQATPGARPRRRPQWDAVAGARGGMYLCSGTICLLQAGPLPLEPSPPAPPSFTQKGSLMKWGAGAWPWPLGAGKGLGLTLPLATQDSDYVVAVRNFLPEDPSLLAFHKGDIIHLQPPEPPRLGRCLGWGGHWRGVGPGAARAVTDIRPTAGYSAGCVVRKKVVYLEELQRRGPDFGGSRVPCPASVLKPQSPRSFPASCTRTTGQDGPRGPSALAWPGLPGHPPSLRPPIWRKGLWAPRFRVADPSVPYMPPRLPEAMPPLPKPRPLHPELEGVS